jgi:AcrR family transcriptional regulator
MAEQTVDMPNRLDRRKARNPATLVRAAQAFIADGKANVLTLEITQAADVGMGSFWNHIQSKEQLYLAAVEDVLDAGGPARRADNRPERPDARVRGARPRGHAGAVPGRPGPGRTRRDRRDLPGQPNARRRQLSRQPAGALPVGTVTDGMPDGVQLIGPWFGERLALAAARDVERACGIATPIDPR